MKRLKKLTLLLSSSFLAVSLLFPALASASPPSFTPEQLKEIAKAEQKTRYVAAHWKEIKQVKKPSSSSVSIQSVGQAGDILVTLDGTSSSSMWAGGHAGVVSDVSGYVVESFGNKGDLNGVRHWPNDWDTRYNQVKGLRVNGATSGDYAYAASYARQQIGKPYNYNFFDITTTSSFYCSQLAWRAFYNLGYDLNDGGAVWPVDLIESPLTYAFYSKG
ncbi:MAG: YiiX/YebB-like N1pC/P60 family cysteine hydrolase [Thermoactinomyces sp.]|jgi:uncharacterized protein YycO